MKRKEIVITSEVFARGLKALEEETVNYRRMGYEMELEVAGTVFQVGVNRQEKAVILHWTGQTLLSNIIWMRFVALRLKRPFIKDLSCFTYF